MSYPPSLVLRRTYIFVAAFLAAAANFFAAESTRKTFDVAAGRAEERLPEFAQQAGVELVFSVDKVAGVQTNAFKGSATAPEALDRILANTALTPIRDPKTGALGVRRRAADTSPGTRSGTTAPPARTRNGAPV